MAVKLSIYLKFNGVCKDAFDFYSKVLRIPLTYSTTYGEQKEMSAVKDIDKDKILHCGLTLEEQIMIWGCDILEGIDDPRWNDPRYVEGTNVILSLDPDNENEAKRLFRELSEGGTIQIPLYKSFWNTLYGMFTDKFGINWMIDYTYEDSI